ncbi:MAG: hypothetical protein ACM3XR_04205 [Bacillota bacterium]
MKKRHGLSGFIFTVFIVFILMFAANAAVMKIFFNINVLDLRYVKAAILKDDGNMGSQRQLSMDGKGEDASGKNLQVYFDSNREDGGGTANGEDAACRDGAGQVNAGDTGTAARAGSAGESNKSDELDEPGYYIFPGEIEFLKNLSLKDKLFALSIISKIDPAVKDRVYEMSKDGVTYSEFAEIRKSVENYLEPADIESLEEIFLRNRTAYAGNGR